MSAFDPSLRRIEGPSLDLGDEAGLVERLRAEIRSSGPITFARFMERALYEPDLGYYRKPVPGPGREGDFLTAPETHPVFGRMLARQLDELWQVLGRPTLFTVREHGAGTGALALAVLEGLVADGSPLIDRIRYDAVEIDPHRRQAIAERLSAAGFGAAAQPTQETPIVGAVLANELLDALPVHRVVRVDGGLRELLVSVVDDRFVEVEAELSTPALANRLDDEAVVLEPGQIAEISLALDDWLADAASGLERGLLLLIDYGYPSAELYGPAHRVGTLMAYARHRAHTDPFVNVGRQDLTTHVDLTAVERAAMRAGLLQIGMTTQAEFLAGLGIGELLPAAQADPGATVESYLQLRASVVRLLDPRATGAFRVLAFGRGLPTDVRLKGFEYRVPPRIRS